MKIRLPINMKSDVVNFKRLRVFTIVELLVVIAIIAILSSMLLPALRKAKESGKKIVCAGRLKQWGTALQMYTSDNEERLPAIIDKKSGWKYWSQTMTPYMPSALSYEPATNVRDLSSLIRCPSRLEGDSYSTPDYAPNSNVFTRYINVDGSVTNLGPRFSQIRIPSKTLLLIDAIGGAMEVSTANRTNPTYSSGCWTSYRHLSCANVLFVDGHITSMKQPRPESTLDILFK